METYDENDKLNHFTLVLMILVFIVRINIKLVKNCETAEL